MKSLDFFRRDPFLCFYGAAVAVGSSFGQTFFISLSGAEIRVAFDLSHSGFGAIYSAGTLMSALVLVWSGQWIDRIDLRVWSVLLYLGLAAACLTMSLSTGPISLFVAVFLLRQFGQGLSSHTSAATPARYFDKDRGKAIAFSGVGITAGEGVFPVVTIAAIAAIGWRETWAWSAAILLGLWLPGALLLLKGHGDRHKAYLAGFGTGETQGPFKAARALGGVAVGTGNASAGPRQWTRAEVIRDARVYLLLPAILAPSFIVTGFFFHQVHIVDSKGWSMVLWAFAFFSYAVTSTVSGLAFGAVIDRIGAVRALPWFLPPLLGCCLVLAFGQAEWAAWGFMIFSGMAGGMIGVVATAFWAEVYGTRHIGGIKALASALSVFASALSPVLLGLGFDAGLSGEQIALACAAYCVVGIVLSILAMRRYRPAA